jgi:malate dehydrogenase (oxaloacetate-decarboxylating)
MRGPFAVPFGMAHDVIETSLTGIDLLSRPLLNKGTAFTDEERHVFGLHGLLPPHVGTLDMQVDRRLRAFRACDTPLERYAFLRDLQDVNETLYYAMLVRYPEELMPIVYTPTVGEGCQRFSEIWRRPRGLFLSYPNRHRIAEILADPRLDRVAVIVVSDGERILGLGDQGTGGMGIPIGKLALYTACAGIHPERTLPIFLDVGTDNQARLDDPLYVGWRNPRIRGEEYDAFVRDFITAVHARWPNVLLQWEDFANQNAGRLLATYRDALCSFNDDIEGTAAVAAGTLLAAIGITGVPLVEQRVALVGAGSAGCGIGALLLRAMIDAGLTEAEARARFFAIDRDGLLIDDMPGLREAQLPFVRTRADVADWSRERTDQISLLDVAKNAKPTVLIGVSGQPGAFSEAAVRAMAANVERPVLFPLSNPTSRAEATPADLITWTNGRALIGTGSPFAPVEFEGRTYPIAQTNNAYIFPGVGLGILATRARRVTDGMFTAAAEALAALSPAKADPHAPLLPKVTELRRVAVAVGLAVGRRAQAEGVADVIDDETLAARIAAEIWEPVYVPYRRV